MPVRRCTAIDASASRRLASRPWPLSSPRVPASRSASPVAVASHAPSSSAAQSCSPPPNGTITPLPTGCAGAAGNEGDIGGAARQQVDEFARRRLAGGEPGRRPDEHEPCVVDAGEPQHVVGLAACDERRHAHRLGALRPLGRERRGGGGESRLVVEQRGRDQLEPRAARERRPERGEQAHGVEVAARHEHGAARLPVGRTARGGKLGVMAQDRLLQVPQRRAGFHPEGLDERGARLAVDLQRVHLAARPIQREHQQLAQPLAQRLGGRQLRQLGNDVRVAPEREQCLHAPFQRVLAQLLQPGDRALGERLGREVRQRLAAPERERVVERREGTGRVLGLERFIGAGAQALEAPQVDRVGLDVHEVAGRASLDGRPLGIRRVQRAAQLGDLAVHLRDRAHRRVARVQLLGDAIDRDDTPGLQEQQREHGPLGAPAEGDLRAVAARLERPEDAELDQDVGTLAVR